MINNPNNSPKKVWTKPDFEILDSNNVQTGGNPNVHEKSFFSNYALKGSAPRAGAWQGIPKAYYVS